MTDSSAKIKQFGKRARARLREENEKRPEIKILDSLKAAPSTTTTKQSNKSISPSLKRPAIQRTNARSKKLKAPPSLNKTWDLTLLPIPEKELRSSTVQLHGLDERSTETALVGHIRRFFTGLKPDYIFMVLSNRIRINGLDAKTKNNLLQHDGVRIFVKFDSSVTATLAVERSGEILKINGADNEEETRDISIPIGVTQLRKDVAKCMLGMSVMACPGVSFQETLSTIEQDLHPMVSKILWKDAADRFGFPLGSEICMANILFATNDDKDDLETFEGYRKHALIHNQLVTLHEELLYQLPFPSVESFESNFSTSFPVVRLTSKAIHLLESHLTTMEQALFRARTSTRMNRNK